MAKMTRRTIAGDPYRDDREVLRTENRQLKQANQRLWRLLELGLQRWVGEQVAAALCWARLTAHLAWEAFRLPAFCVIGVIGMLSVGSITFVGLDRLAATYGADVGSWFSRIRPAALVGFMLDAGVGGDACPLVQTKDRRVLVQSRWVMAAPVDRRILAMSTWPFSAQAVTWRARMLYHPYSVTHIELPGVGLVKVRQPIAIEVSVGAAEALQEAGDNG